jgi:hypothetical protein
MMWAIYSDGAPFVVSGDLKGLTKTCDDLNNALSFKFTIREWIDNDEKNEQRR